MSFGNTVKDGSGNAYWLLVDSGGRLIVSQGHTIDSIVSEVDGSDKTYTVPVGIELHIQSIYVTLVTSATVGDRQVELEIKDTEDNIIFKALAGVVQAASLTRTYLFAPNVADMAAFVDTTHISNLIPALQLAAGYVVRVYDNNVVSAVSDDLTMVILCKSVDA